MTNNKSVVIQVSSNGMGTADKDLEQTLIKNYITLINKENYLPKVIIFYAEGVKLLCEDSAIVDHLKDLTEKNVKILACKTCLNHYGLIDKIKVGIVATMVDIIDIQFSADKVINV